jgi:hypothetical protein
MLPFTDGFCKNSWICFMNSVPIYKCLWILKVIIFKREHIIAGRECWVCNNTKIDIVNEFSYVCIYFTFRLCLYKMGEEKAKNVFTHIVSSLNNLGCLPYQTFFKIFDVKVSAILLYYYCIIVWLRNMENR